MATRIKNGTSKKIWKIRLFLLIISFLLIIITLGLSIMVPDWVYTPRPPSTVYVLLGSGGPKPYQLKYGEDFEARWTVREFRFQSDGRFLIDLQFDYLSSEIPFSQYKTSTVEVDFEYVGSTALLEIISVYTNLTTLRSYRRATGVIPIAATSVSSKLCFAEYEGEFYLPSEKKGEYKLYGIVVTFSWIRVFREKNDEQFYYQWMQGGLGVSAKNDERLEADKTCSNISGDFRVYYPIPESMTSPLVTSLYEFDYVEWIRENM